MFIVNTSHKKPKTNNKFCELTVVCDSRTWSKLIRLKIIRPKAENYRLTNSIKTTMHNEKLIDM